MNQLEKTLTSLEVAEMVGRPHDNVLKDIRRIIDQLGDVKSYESYFINTTYTNSQNKVYPQFLLTKKGCELYATRMTGEKGTQFAIAYIERFNKMEKKLNKPMSQLEIMQMQIGQLVEQDKRISVVEQNQKDIVNIFSINAKNWRREVNDLIIKIAKTKNNLDAYRDTRNESYMRLEERGKCDLKRRLENKRERMRMAGSSKTAIERINRMDVIAEDERLIEIHLTVVKEMAIANNVSVDKNV